MASHFARYGDCASPRTEIVQFSSELPADVLSQYKHSHETR